MLEMLLKTIGGQPLQVGFSAHRLIENDPYYQKEINFVKAINQDMEMNKQTLSQITNQKHLTLDQETLILTVIQWLGTPVGQGFIDKVSKMK